MKVLLWIGAIVSIVTYLFWESFPKGSFYIGNSLFILILCIFIYVSYKTWFISFLLLCLSLSNFMDELFFEPTILGYNEIILLIVLPAIWLYKNRNDQRKSI